MKVLRSIRRPPLSVRCYWANAERKEVFFLAQLLMRNLHTGLVISGDELRRICLLRTSVNNDALASIVESE